MTRYLWLGTAAWLAMTAWAGGAAAVAAPADEQAWTQVTVEMVGGARHRDVTLRWALGGLRLAAGERAHVRFGYRRLRVREDAGVPLRQVSAQADELQLLVGMRMTHPRDNSNYSYLEAGLVQVGGQARAGTGAVLQGGVVLPVSPRLGVDLGALLMSRPSLDDQADQTVICFGVQAALAARW